MKIVKAIVGIIIVLSIAWFIIKPGTPNVPIAQTNNNNETSEVATGDTTQNNEEQAASESQTYTLAPESTIQWLGKKVAWAEHFGDISIKKGTINVKDDAIVGGTFTVDMTSIKATDINDESLDSHLKADDFFDAENYPEATFEIVSVDGKTVEGKLTIKDITNNITFDATSLTITEDKVTVAAEFAIDRTQWGVNGGLPAVSEYCEFSFNLEFTK